MDMDREVVTLVTQVIVDKNDPAIQEPTKFVGPRYNESEIKPLAEKFGWAQSGIRNRVFGAVWSPHQCRNTSCMENPSNHW